MWFIKKVGTKSVTYLLHHGEELNVSRLEDSWLPLPNDNSISRKHAIIRVLHSSRNVIKSIPSSVELQDLNSKNGTYVKRSDACSASDDHVPIFTDSDRIGPGSKVILQEGDLIRFGINNYCYKLCRNQINITTSMVQDKSPILNQLLTLGGCFMKKWSTDCTLLVMDTIKLTAKVACCLGCCKLIVTPQFITALCTSVLSKQPAIIPSAQMYLPQISEPNIQQDPSLFEPNPLRSQLFAERILLFSNHEALKSSCDIVKYAGGQCDVLSLPQHEAALRSGEALLVRVMADTTCMSQDSPMVAAIGILKNQGLHPVPVSDIVLAVLYCSTKNHCNPALSQQLLLATSQKSLSTQCSPLSSVVLAPETQLLTHPSAPSPMVLPGSPTLANDTSRKRRRSDDHSPLRAPSPKRCVLQDTELMVETEVITEISKPSVSARVKPGPPVIQSSSAVRAILEDTTGSVKRCLPLDKSDLKDANRVSNQSEDFPPSKLSRYSHNQIDVQHEKTAVHYEKTAAHHEKTAAHHEKTAFLTSMHIKEEPVSQETGFITKKDVPENIIEATSNRSDTNVSERNADVSPVEQFLCQSLVVSLLMPSGLKNITNDYSIRGSSHKKNFKRFKKITCSSESRLPRIIGGNDLLPHSHFKENNIEAWVSQRPDVCRRLQAVEQDTRSTAIDNDDCASFTKPPVVAPAAASGFALPSVNVRGRRNRAP